MADKLFQIESEVAAISLILNTPDLVHAAPNLRYFMFSSTPHQVIFAEIEELVSKRLNPDPVLIIESLDAKNLLASAGGKRYVDLLLEKEYQSESFLEFVKLVVDSYKARQYLSITATPNKSEITASNIDEYIYNTRKSLDGLIEVGGKLEAQHVGDLAKETYEEILSRREKPGVRGTPWGVRDIDKATGGKNGGDMWVIGGRPGAGKTALVCNSVYQDGINGVPSLLIEREMRSQELMERLITIDTGIPNTNIRLGVLSDEQVGRIYDSLAKLKKLPIYLDTNYRACDPRYVEATVNKFHNKYGVKVVYLDYIQLLADRDDNQTQEIGQLTRLFKLMSNELDICSVLLSQLNRNVESRDDKRPLLSDMKQSGAIEEDSDYVVGLYRDEYYNKETKYKGLMEYIILKNRNGPPGTVTIGFNGETNKIGDAR